MSKILKNIIFIYIYQIYTRNRFRWKCTASEMKNTFGSDDTLYLIYIRKRRNVSIYVVKHLVSIFRSMNLKGCQNNGNVAPLYISIATIHLSVCTFATRK